MSNVIDMIQHYEMRYYVVAHAEFGNLSECYRRQERAEAELERIRVERPSAFVMEARMNFNPRRPSDKKRREYLTKSLR